LIVTTSHASAEEPLALRLLVFIVSDSLVVRGPQDPIIMRSRHWFFDLLHQIQDVRFQCLTLLGIDSGIVRTHLLCTNPQQGNVVVLGGLDNNFGPGSGLSLFGVIAGALCEWAARCACRRRSNCCLLWEINEWIASPFVSSEKN